MTRAVPGVVIFSLTDAGRRLAEVVSQIFDDVEIRHRPDDFLEAAREEFGQGKPCVFICATGIVIRALAPVLRDKFTDPPVVVLDERGNFVIPLLSSHEGGGGELARVIADHIDAQLVVTSVTDYSRALYCLGVGSDRGCPEHMIKALLDKAMAQLNHPVKLSLAASIDIKQDEAGIVNVARRLGVPLTCFPAADLRRMDDLLTVKSEIVFRETGCYGVAEGAALWGAQTLTGNPPELVLAKIKNERATLAIARSFQP